jgi:hypothetical protein
MFNLGLRAAAKFCTIELFRPRLSNEELPQQVALDPLQNAECNNKAGVFCSDVSKMEQFM